MSCGSGRAEQLKDPMVDRQTGGVERRFGVCVKVCTDEGVK